MKAREYEVMEMCVREASKHVWRRAFKHAVDPPQLTDKQHDTFQNAIVDEIMNGIATWFEFDDVALEAGEMTPSIGSDTKS